MKDKLPQSSANDHFKLSRLNGWWHSAMTTGGSWQTGLGREAERFAREQALAEDKPV